jgi:hypothetical protein
VIFEMKHSTPNIQCSTPKDLARPALVGCSVLNVEYPMFSHLQK